MFFFSFLVQQTLAMREIAQTSQLLKFYILNFNFSEGSTSQMTLNGTETNKMAFPILNDDSDTVITFTFDWPNQKSLNVTLNYSGF